jgi:acetyl-CoA C-acetyltransferase
MTWSLGAPPSHPETTSMNKPSSLDVIHPEIKEFSITAGNAAGINDGAAAMVLADRELAESAAVDILAKVEGWASVGVKPERTGLAHVEAIKKALARADLRAGDIDLWEINEAFASVCIATTRQLGIDENIVREHRERDG